MLQQLILPGFGVATSSPELPDGRKPCVSPDGPTASPSGPEARPASPSAPQESVVAETTPATSVPDLSNWCGPDAPLCCSANRSRARTLSDALQSRANAALDRNLRGHGGMIYRFAWKRQDTPHGRQLFLLRPSAHPTSAKDCSSPPSIFDMPPKGWTTPQAHDASGRSQGQKAIHGTKHGCACLVRDADLTAWPTPTTRDWKDGGNPDVDVPLNGLLERVVWLAGWPTTRAADSEKNVRTAEGALREIERKGTPQDLAQGAAIAGWGTPSCQDDNQSRMGAEAMAREWNRPGASQSNLAKQAFILTQNPQPARFTVSGDLLTGSCAGMSGGGQLNPEHSRWLMGYPAAWGSCGATAMQSCRKPPRSSSTPAAKS